MKLVECKRRKSIFGFGKCVLEPEYKKFDDLIG